jgi:hypothetical protein
MTRAKQGPGGEVADLAHEVDQQIARFDALRAEGLERLAAVHEGRRAGLERERKRLEAWGGADDPRLLALDERLTRDRALAGAARVEAERARTTAPEVGEAQWVVYGRVLDGKLTPVAGVVVSAHDADGTLLEALGRASTGDRGEFRLVEDLQEERQTPAHLRVHDEKGTLLHVDERPLVPLRGRAEHVEIVLGKRPRPFSMARKP